MINLGADLCLGELHAVFAHLHTNGSFISGSDFGDLRIAAGWFDSQCLVRQLLECSEIKRANLTQEAAVIAINTLLFQVLMSSHKDDFRDKVNIILTLLTTLVYI